MNQTESGRTDGRTDDDQHLMRQPSGWPWN